ncbi:TrmH family RNA methyltransferase [Reinekea blandensis]|uniref:tRNA (guanosine(18)-2'-O)-methyltransferase n=1 Tax=Reinekea blandensis MED297 TaxID=314283 RepID=A4BEK2_9GAMM|nr:TrmH family RNA methyltransferase [Reinekea blandensis]EAR09429.1 putative tRNA methyltransferase [Reinekea sp. MED297] [Reinekea blandensis MED297]
MPISRYLKFQQVLNQRQNDMTILTDKVHKSQNVSAIMRTADSVGIPTVHMVKPERGRLVYHHTAGGASRFVDVIVYETLSEGIQSLRNAGMALYAAHWSDRAISYREADYTRPFALILGAEKYGISPEAADAADEHLIIPMVGACESLNVSVASGIILQEAMHQRMAQQAYTQLPDQDSTYHNTLFRWLHPKMAAFCDARQLPYPQLDEDGDMIPPQGPEYRQS